MYGPVWWFVFALVLPCWAYVSFQSDACKEFGGEYNFDPRRALGVWNVMFAWNFKEVWLDRHMYSNRTFPGLNVTKYVTVKIVLRELESYELEHHKAIVHGYPNSEIILEMDIQGKYFDAKENWVNRTENSVLIPKDNFGNVEAFSIYHRENRTTYGNSIRFPYRYSIKWKVIDGFLVYMNCETQRILVTSDTRPDDAKLLEVLKKLNIQKGNELLNAFKAEITRNQIENSKTNLNPPNDNNINYCSGARVVNCLPLDEMQLSLVKLQGDTAHVLGVIEKIQQKHKLAKQKEPEQSLYSTRIPYKQDVLSANIKQDQLNMLTRYTSLEKSIENIVQNLATMSVNMKKLQQDQQIILAKFAEVEKHERQELKEQKVQPITLEMINRLEIERLKYEMAKWQAERDYAHHAQPDATTIGKAAQQEHRQDVHYESNFRPKLAIDLNINNNPPPKKE